MVWRVVDDAAVDLQHIAEDGILNFGESHARRYTVKLVDMFDTLAALPYMASPKQAAQREVRLMPCGAHNIVYVIENEDVIILRVLHGLQDWFDLL
ncbi:MAG: type II toxin-antitoxin system RelE/ParE family toxin [Candidatus Devosia phytovorans]|uniref:Type II toxin-antitoxin system RelE/ParE family toxin n=1 Tax=Candidatus Devosia phytovorans TaxID=3121372 RepID=A0AAJ5VWQ6_9HYPH|nr:type II toxin-antitoxin system RelE/ParE family toxin [Devosia sp.]WEK04892.1 MAG: type II toxin-antitoxin system RelE/ParE family toxin [Devosia sp.]